MDNTRDLEEITWRQAIEQVLREAGRPLHYLEIAGRIIMSGFQTTGRTPERTVSKELTQHPDLFRRVGEGVYELVDQRTVESLNTSPEVEDVLAVIEPRSAGAHRGQGFQSSVQVRRATERHAMDRAKTHFAEQGWQVEDVSARAPFDLKCVKPKRTDLRVEVKGTTGDGTQILLTRNEVDHAHTVYPDIALFVLHHIDVEVKETEVMAYGGSPRIILPWDIRSGILVPLGFSYSPGE
jgi:hypothetical protein